MDENFVCNNDFYKAAGIELYIKELMNIPMLSEQEKQELPLLIEKGDIEAKNRFIEGNLRLVLYTVNEFNKKYDISIKLYDDYISVGNEALIKAVNTFDYKKEIQFSTYAVNVIKNALYTYHVQNISCLKYSHRFYENYVTIKNYLRDEKLNNKSYVSIDDIVKDTGISYETICIIFDTLKPVVYLDKELNEENDINKMSDLLEDKRIDFYKESDFSDKNLHEFVEAVMKSKRINKKQLEILLYRNGFYNDKNYLLTELSKMYNITPSAVHYVYNTAIKKLLLDPNVLKYAPDSYKLSKSI